MSCRGLKVQILEAKIRAELEIPKGKIRRKGECERLHAREIDVLIKRLEGKSPSQIVEELDIRESSRTYIFKHFETIRAVLGVQNDMELAFFAYERGWVITE